MLPTIGTVSECALKKGNKNIRLDKKEYLSIPSSFLWTMNSSWFNRWRWYIQVTRTTKGFYNY